MISQTNCQVKEKVINDIESEFKTPNDFLEHLESKIKSCNYKLDKAYAMFLSEALIYFLIKDQAFKNCFEIWVQTLFKNSLNVLHFLVLLNIINKKLFETMKKLGFIFGNQDQKANNLFHNIALV